MLWHNRRNRVLRPRTAGSSCWPGPVPRRTCRSNNIFILHEKVVSGVYGIYKSCISLIIKWLMPQCYSNVNDSCANNNAWDRMEMDGLGLWKICLILCKTALNYIRKPPAEIMFIHHIQGITENSESLLCMRMKKYMWTSPVFDIREVPESSDALSFYLQS